MKVVFKKTGQLKQVPDGYARNYLIPNGIAVQATDAEVARITTEQSQQRVQVQQQQSALHTALEQFSDTGVTLKRQANADGVLFGAVSAKDIVKEANVPALKAEWFESVHLKTIGEHTLTLTLPDKTTHEVRVRIEPLS